MDNPNLNLPEEMTAIEADELLEELAKHEAVIKAAEAERDEFIDHYEAKISHAREICDSKTIEARQAKALLEERLKRYATSRITDKKKSIALPTATMSFRRQQPKIFDDKAREVNGSNEWLIEFVRKNMSDLLKVKVIESVDWLQFKTRLTTDGEVVSMKESGEVINGLHAQQLPDKFKIDWTRLDG